MAERLSINLFDPGMTHIHRVGLAGLYTTLDTLNKDSPDESVPITWDLRPDGVDIEFNNTPAEGLAWLFERAYGIDSNGLIDIKAHHVAGLSDLEKVSLHKVILNTYLQHNKQNRIPRGMKQRPLITDLDSEVVGLLFRPLIKPYAYMDGHKKLITSKGDFKKKLRIKGWLFPGAAERHSGLSGTEIEETPERFICLLCAPIASLYFNISHRTPEGKYDKRRGSAIIFPHINDLAIYSRAYRRYLSSPVEKLHADSIGDAALLAMLQLKTEDVSDQIGVDGCFVTLFGALQWASQQQIRTECIDISQMNQEQLELFDISYAALPNRKWISQAVSKETGAKKFSVFPSLSRGLIANNIARGNEWFEGFASLMNSDARAKQIFFEKEGLNAMVQKAPWNQEEDKLFIEAMHSAIRNRYGQLASQATARNERIPFDREYTRIRTSLARCKNEQTLRAELADLLSRAGVNKTLQESWQRVLPLYLSKSWQRTRDLALLALASYKGAGADQLKDEETDI